MTIVALVLCMIIVGGATRLTDSGLSITHWSPIHGVIPPLNAKEWAAEFELYKKIPEYQLQNKGMSLTEFQFIFWWEWAHRLLGRVIGLAFGLPLIVFLAMGYIRKTMAPWLIAMLALGGLQGFIGWWMVSSGLSGDRLDVAAYRLATHLSMAFLLMSLTLWTALNLLAPRKIHEGDPQIAPWAIGFVLLLAFQIMLGAFVAGTDSGMIYNDWPTFDGGWFPKTYAALSPYWRNWVENAATIQFNHRIGAYSIGLCVFLLWLKTRRSKDRSVVAWGQVVALLVLFQIVLGIATLIGYRYWTPPHVNGVLLGISHQGLGAILFTSSMMLMRASIKPRPKAFSVAV
ncbi:COX15/CtaA family protein [Candidatus Phycosocius spiralis]|uniref:COX15/CtaA family protein n=1 Tax=Candidatus Phycosocius spiralis TaxID=2815099 RepID=UPI0024E10992|nr:COX15/CtaA family protein [Candidatus Phycosocius spiralis]